MHSAEKLSTFALIVGAGPVGVGIGALLSKQEVPVLVVDQNDGPTDYSKAIGVHARTLELMHALDLSEAMVSDGYPMSDYGLWEEGKSILAASFRDVDTPYPFVLGLPQSRTERHLSGALIDNGGAIRRRTRLIEIESTGDPARDDAKAVALLEGEDGKRFRVEADWLIGCDGNRSLVREQMGAGFPGGDYKRAFILGDVKIDWDGPKRHLQFHLGPNGYLLIIPMPRGMHRLIAQTDLSYEDFQKRERPEATLEELQAIVDRNGPGGIRVHSPEWLTCAPFYHRMADKAKEGRVLLAGDAFHLYSPLGAQGLNTGFGDVFNLGWKLGFVAKGHAGPELIDTYEAERRPIAEMIQKITAKTTRFITATAWHERLARRIATPRLDRTDRVQKRLPTLLAGMMQRYPADGPLAGPGVAGLPEPGTRMPHAFVADGDAYLPVARLVHGTRFTILHMVRLGHEEAFEAVRRVTEERVAGLPYAESIVVAREITAPVEAAGVPVYEDRLSRLFDKLAFDEAAVVCVRPDGFVAAAGRGATMAEAAEPVFTWLESLFAAGTQGGRTEKGYRDVA